MTRTPQRAAIGPTSAMMRAQMRERTLPAEPAAPWAESISAPWPSIEPCGEKWKKRDKATHEGGEKKKKKKVRTKNCTRA